MTDVNKNTKVNEMTQEQMEQLLGGSMPTFDKPVDERPASANQIKYYNDLCEQKHVTPEEKDWTSVTINAEIQRLKTLPFWKEVSQNQIDRITELCGVLKMATPDFTKLNGAYNGSASQLIQMLKEKAKNVEMPISEAQIVMIQSMQYCPACELIEDVTAMTKTEASDYIAKHKEDFYEWKSTRLSPEQAKLIAELTRRLNGEPMEYKVIILFDQETATKYIEQLEKELADKTLTESTLEPEEMRGILEKDHEDERKELRTLIARLYASLGQAFEEEVYETLDWNSIKELVDMSKLYGNDVRAMFENLHCFTENQKEALLA